MISRECRLLAILLCLSLHHTKLASSRLGGDDFMGGGSSDVEVDCIPDITDMTDYDPVTQTSARCERLKREKQQARYKCESNLAEAQRNLEKCLKGKDLDPCPPPANCESEPNAVAQSSADTVKAEDMFFFRLTRHLVNVLQEKAPEKGPIEAQLEVHLTSHEWKKLQNFVEGKEAYRKADIHDILVGMTIDIFHFNETSIVEWLGETINFRSPGIILLMMSVCVITLVFSIGMYSDLYWNARFRGCLLTSIFLSSLLWNWIYLYQEETIKRYRNAQKYEDIPASCMPQKMTWAQVLMEWYRTTLTVQTDPCFDYHRLYLVDPILDIHPARVLAFTVSSIFVEPMKYFGRAVSEFHAEIFGGLPFWAAIPALLSCYVFMFVLLYAYIAAPRRIQREAQHRGAAREIIQPRPVEDAPRRQIKNRQAVEEEDDEAFMCEDREENRVENVQPPTLPPVVHDDHKEPTGQCPPRNRPHDRRCDIPPGPSGHAKPVRKDSREARRKSGNISPGGRQRFEDDPPSPAGAAYRGAQSPQGLSHDQPQPSQQHSDTRYQGDSKQQDPAVRPKSINSRIIQQQIRDDGNETDISNFSSMELSQIQRPTDFGWDGPPRSKAQSTRPMARTSSMGDTNTGNVVTHPSSEPSDVESLRGSVIGVQSVFDETTDSSWEASAVEKTTATDGATPISVDSPSDISVISQSPENTNSATYDFISMPEEQDCPSADDPSKGREEHDDEDEFEILERESHQTESTRER